VLSGVCDSGVSEEGLDPFRCGGHFIHVHGGGGLQFGFRSHRDFGCDFVFEAGVESFVRVQFRRVTGKVEDFNLVAMLCHPQLHRLTVMHARVIKDEKHFASSLFDKCLQELDQSLMIEVTVDDLPAGLALIGDGLDHR